jgi:hypothetical protein
VDRTTVAIIERVVAELSRTASITLSIVLMQPKLHSNIASIVGWLCP